MRATSEALSMVARVRGVRAAVLATVDDALPVGAVTHVDVDADALAAFGTSLLRRARQAAGASALGGVQFVALEASDGRVFVAARGELLLIALAGREVHGGLVRVTLQRCLESVA